MKPENIKIVEIRDRATLIAAFAIRMRPETEHELFLFKEIGYRSQAKPCILLISMQAPNFSARYSGDWQNTGRTFPIAHEYIEKHFDEINNYDVIDVEFIKGEVDKPCDSVVIEGIKELAEELAKYSETAEFEQEDEQ